jgi:hypothetical protein
MFFFFFSTVVSFSLRFARLSASVCVCVSPCEEIEGEVRSGSQAYGKTSAPVAKVTVCPSLSLSFLLTWKGRRRELFFTTPDKSRKQYQKQQQQKDKDDKGATSKGKPDANVSMERHPCCPLRVQCRSYPPSKGGNQKHRNKSSGLEEVSVGKGVEQRWFSLRSPFRFPYMSSLTERVLNDHPSPFLFPAKRTRFGCCNVVTHLSFYS